MSGPLKNSRYEAFAQNVAKGMLPIDAFRALDGKGKRAGDGTSANRLLKIAEDRIAELGRLSATSTTLTMSERRAFLARVVRCDLSRIDTAKDGDLIQEIIINEQGTKLKLPGKRECLLLDAQLAGEMVEKVDMSLKDKRVLPPEERARLLRESIARRTHGRS